MLNCIKIEKEGEKPSISPPPPSGSDTKSQCQHYEVGQKGSLEPLI